VRRRGGSGCVQNPGLCNAGVVQKPGLCGAEMVQKAGYCGAENVPIGVWKGLDLYKTEAHTGFVSNGCRALCGSLLCGVGDGWLREDLQGLLLSIYDTGI
jgi:hypothetical protein